jgi:hypothetical protein
MIRWFANVALVAGTAGEPAAIADGIEAAVAAGRTFVAFELFGTPAGFDMYATRTPGAGDVIAEIGGEVAVGDGAILELSVPSVFALDAALPAPDIRAVVYRVDAGGRTEVAAGAGPALTVSLDAPGAYRAEVLITPRHLGPYLGTLGPADAEREHVWIYSNPIYVIP